ncbi:hypothetical protein LCGC14_2078670 [marine sediment metagenome]|uniref:Uncharacterized protein n=1 Tax=marine sediment metagenome TaxID=412755 RepID=A0A0F9EGG5_9ZZZZ
MGALTRKNAMKTEKVVIRRFNTIPGIGAKVLNTSVDVPQAETAEEILDLFTGTEKERWDQVLDSVNRARRAEARSKTIDEQGGSDPKSAVALVKKAIGVFKVLFPDKSKSEVAQIVVTSDLREMLKSEGVEFGDPKELRKKYDAEIQAALDQADIPDTPADSEESA